MDGCNGHRLDKINLLLFETSICLMRQRLGISSFAETALSLVSFKHLQEPQKSSQETDNLRYAPCQFPRSHRRLLRAPLAASPGKVCPAFGFIKIPLDIMQIRWLCSGQSLPSFSSPLLSFASSSSCEANSFSEISQYLGKQMKNCDPSIAVIRGRESVEESHDMDPFFYMSIC